VAGLAALEAIAQIFDGEQRGSGNDDRSQLHGRQHDLPDGHHVGQHDHDAVAAADAVLAQEIRHLVGAARHLLETQLQLRAAFIENPQRRLPVSFCIVVEIVEGPVELGELRPAEVAVGGRVIFTMAKEEVARGEK